MVLAQDVLHDWRSLFVSQPLWISSTSDAEAPVVCFYPSLHREQWHQAEQQKHKNVFHRGYKDEGKAWRPGG